MEKIHCY